MTTSNGSSQGRIVEQVDGQVAASNERAVKLIGEDAYRNFSRYTAEPIAPPRRIRAPEMAPKPTSRRVLLKEVPGALAAN